MVKLYTKTVCPKCLVAKSMLTNNEVSFEPINIDTDEKSKQKLIDLGFMAAPIAEHDGKYYCTLSEIEDLIEQIK